MSSTKVEKKIKSASKNEMNQLHQMIANTLKDAIQSESQKVDEETGEKCGNPLPAIREAIKFMKDNGITYMPEANMDDDGLDSLDEALANVLPFPVRRNGTSY